MSSSWNCTPAPPSPSPASTVEAGDGSGRVGEDRSIDGGRRLCPCSGTAGGCGGDGCDAEGAAGLGGALNAGTAMGRKLASDPPSSSASSPSSAPPSTLARRSSAAEGGRDTGAPAVCAAPCRARGELSPRCSCGCVCAAPPACSNSLPCAEYVLTVTAATVFGPCAALPSSFFLFLLFSFLALFSSTARSIFSVSSFIQRSKKNCGSL